MELYEKLLNIQQELKAPKNRKNRFGGYSYRNTEDIFTAAKPLLSKYGVILTVTDELLLIGDRYYVKAEAHLFDTESGIEIKTCAYAREQLERKKSDASQLTGAASSYARKYALNGLFLIDDEADPDAYGADDPDEELDELEEEEQRKPRSGRKKRDSFEAINEDSPFYTVIEDDEDEDEDEESDVEEEEEEEERKPVTRRKRNRRD